MKPAFTKLDIGEITELEEDKIFTLLVENFKYSPSAAFHTM